MARKCLGEVIRRNDQVEYVHSYHIAKGHPDKALLEPCPNEIAGMSAGLQGCGCYCRQHCGSPIEGNWLGYGEDHGDDVRERFAELPNGHVEAAAFAAEMTERIKRGD